MKLGCRKAIVVGLAGLTAAIAAGVLASGTIAAGQGTRATSTLSLKWGYSYTVDPVNCPPGTREPSTCFVYSGKGQLPGLGDVTVNFIDRIDTTNEQCVRDLVYDDGTIADARGTLIFSAEPPPDGPCIPIAPGTIPLVYSITGGTGVFVGASGSGALTLHNPQGRFGTGFWDGTVSAPEYTFDVTAPVLQGAVAKKVVVPRRARNARVRFSVTAVDAVDGKVPAWCGPRSGSRFRIGRTKVHCTAVDTSANTANAVFTVTVRHRRR